MFDGGVVQPDGVSAMLAVLAVEEPPGPAAVARLTSIDPARLTGAQQVDQLTALERQAAWLAAHQVRVLAAMDHPTDAPPDPGRDQRSGLPELVPGPGDEQWTALEVAAALRLSPLAAERRLDVARELHSRLPGTLAALSAGRIGYLHALSIAETTQPLSGEVAAAVQDRVIGKAAGQSVGQLRRALARAVISADPHGAQARHDRATAERRVDMWGLPDGTATLQMVGPAAEVSAVSTALSALADRPTRPDDDRPAGARRFDALHDTFADILAAGTDPAGRRLPDRHGQRPHIGVTVPASTLLGLDQQPGELTGYGPITAHVARRIAAAGTWRRILHDPADGHLLHYDRTTYTPPADLQAHIITRDRTCTFPHCTQPAQRCDIDHAIPWDHGGTTDPDNCGALCRRHHQAKTHGGWQLKRNPDHSCTWTSPAGHTYTVHPPPYDDHP